MLMTATAATWMHTQACSAMASHAWIATGVSSPQKASSRLTQPLTPSSNTSDRNTQTIHVPRGLWPSLAGARPCTRARTWRHADGTDGLRSCQRAGGAARTLHSRRAATIAQAA